jgi:cellulose synthase operon protein C
MKRTAFVLSLALGGTLLFPVINGQLRPALFGAAEPFPMVAQAQVPAPAPATPPAPVQTELTPSVPAPSLTPAQPTNPAPAPTASPAASSGPAVDETALRYFARQGDTERLQREIERLRALYPGWQPPADPLAEDYVPDADIIRIWELFNAGDYAAARAAIASKEEADPGFVPSPDLLQSLALGEATLRLRNASDAGEYNTVISVAANEPQLLVCESVDNLWRLAEAFTRIDADQRAIDAYTYILTNCTDAAERFATMQKAIDLLDRRTIEPLFALERPDASGTGEFEPLRLDLARRSIAASLEDDGDPPLPADVELFADAVADSDDVEDLRLLGYFQLADDEPEEARDLFERAYDLDPSAVSAEALGVALLQLEEFEEAEAALADHWDETETITALYLDAAAATLSQDPRVDLDDDVLERIVEATMDQRDANVAQELGWYAYNFQQPETAEAWFRLSLTWQSDLEPAAYGLMVASDALGDKATVDSIRSQWGARSARIAQFGRTTTSSSSGIPAPTTVTPPLPEARPARPQDARRQQQSPPPAAQPAATTVLVADAAPRTGSGASSCQNYVPPGSLSPGGALNHAWCLMGLNRPAQAVDHFARALQSSSASTRSDAAYGQSLAYIRLGLADEAAVAAAAAPLTQARALELEVSILTEKAIAAYNIGDYARAIDIMNWRSRYAAERNDLLTLRAWSYYHLKRYREAAQIFEAVAATGYGDAASGLEAANAALRN